MISAFVLCMTAGILALAALALDGGLALATRTNAVGQAEQAARAGAQHIDLAAYRATGTVQLDPAAATAAAQAFLASEGAHGTVTVTRNDVTVTITEIRHTQLLGVVGIHTFTVHGAGHAQPARGITGIENEP